MSDKKPQESYNTMLNDDQSFSNHVLRSEANDKIVYYLPAYLRMTVRKIHNIDLGSSCAQASGTLICSVYYGGLPKNDIVKPQKPPKQNPEYQEQQWYVSQLMTKMAITVNSHSELTFASQSDMFLQRALRITHDKKKKIFNYIVRDTFLAQLTGDIALTPFQTLRTIETSFIQKKKIIELRFNMMDTPNPEKLLIKLRTDAGQYSVAEKLCSIAYLNNKQQYDKIKPQKHNNLNYSPNIKSQINQQIHTTNQTNCKLIQKQNNLKSNKDKNKQKLLFWQHAHIKIVLYKHPFTTIFSIMMPMWILATIVQLAFFQQNDLGGTISSVGIALVAYMAFIPTVRQKIPPSPQFTFIELVIVLLLITSMLCVVRGFLNHGIVDIQYVWSDDPIFLISLVLNFSTVAITIILLITFYIYWQKSYTQKVSQQVGSFDKKNWKNIRANSHFYGNVTLVKDL